MTINYSKLSATEQDQIKVLVNNSTAQYPVVWGCKINDTWQFMCSVRNPGKGWLVVGGFSA